MCRVSCPSLAHLIALLFVMIITVGRGVGGGGGAILGLKDQV